MMQPTFLNCFGYTNKKNITAPLLSPVDLLDQPTARKLFRVCRAAKNDCLDHASDYELFRALCKARLLLSGHPTLERFEYALQHFLGISLPLCEDCCDAVWKACVDRLFSSSVTKWSLLDQGRAADVYAVFEPHELFGAVPQGIQPVLNSSTLHQTLAGNWETWRAEMEMIFSAFALHGCQNALFHLPYGFCDVEPNPYSVGKALQEKNSSEQDLLLAQTFRFLCQTCVDKNWRLILSANAPQKEVLSLLRRTEQTVGLPELIWTAKSYETTEALLDFSLQKHPRVVRCGICLADHPSDRELEYWLAFCAARYPIGCITVLSGTELLDSLYEQERFLRTWQRVMQSIE